MGRNIASVRIAEEFFSLHATFCIILTFIYSKAMTKTYK